MSRISAEAMAHALAVLDEEHKIGVYYNRNMYPVNIVVAASVLAYHVNAWYGVAEGRNDEKKDKDGCTQDGREGGCGGDCQGADCTERCDCTSCDSQGEHCDQVGASVERRIE